MKEFFVLLKYGIAFFQSSRTRNKRLSWSSYTVPALMIGFISFFVTHETFVALSRYDPFAPKIFVNFWTTLLSLFFIIGFVGLSINSFTLNEEIEFLLNLPIRKTVLLAYQIFVSTLTQLFALFLYIGVYVSFATVSNNVFLNLMKGLLQIIFMVSFAAFLTILIGRKLKRTFVKRLVMFMNIVTPFLIFLLVGINMNIPEAQGNEPSILKYLYFSFSNYNFLTWPIKDGVFPFLSALLSIFFIVSFIWLSKDTEFSQTESKTKKKVNLKFSSSGNPIKAIYLKDIKTALRIDQFIFFIIYPFAFGIFMAVINNDIFTAIFGSMPIIIIYVALESAILTAKEYLYIDTVRTYPVKFKNILLPKIIIPSALNLVILFIELMIFYFLKDLGLKFFVFLPISFLLLVMNSFMGAYQTIKNPPKTENINRVLSFGSIMLVEGITLGSVFAIIFPMMKLLTDGFDSSLQKYLIGYLLPFSTLAACLIYSRYLYSKLTGHE
jgi:ABC-2 type transport system permease protein